mmetsp:Transcript_8190/g.10600  ORF Transcript_8190/g.10600 Transcript_8190/m.10600 type:complete len:292 (-) Transcript_8190:96-971(-)
MGDSAAFPSVAQSHATEAVPSVFGSSGTQTNQRNSRQPNGQTGPLRFSKKHAPMGLNAPSKTVFSVKVASKTNRNKGGRKAGGSVGGAGFRVSKPIPKAGASLAAIKNKGKKPVGGRMGSRTQPTSSTFMTGVPSQSRVVMNRRDKAGQDAQISTWLQQKKGGTRNRTTKAGLEKPGGKTNLKGFQELRGQMDKRKDDLRKNLARGGKTGGTSLPSIRQNRSTSSSSLFTAKSSASTGRRSTSMSRSSTGARSSSLTRSKGTIGGTANNTGSKLPRVGGASGATKARRKAW